VAQVQQQAQPQDQPQQQTEAQAEQQVQAATQQEEVAEEIAEGTAGTEEEWTMPLPLDQVDLEASLVMAVPADSGGLDPHRAASGANYMSHGLVYSGPLDRDPRDNTMTSGLTTPEWIDPVSLRMHVNHAKFHDGSTLVAGDLAFSYDRMGEVAKYHDRGAACPHSVCRRGSFRPQRRVG